MMGGVDDTDFSASDEDQQSPELWNSRKATPEMRSPAASRTSISRRPRAARRRCSHPIMAPTPYPVATPAELPRTAAPPPAPDASRSRLRRPRLRGLGTVPALFPPALARRGAGDR